jgi:hypothetical protein
MTASDRLPGSDILETGLADLAGGIESIPALLVSIGAPRLRRLGVAVPPPSELPSDPERRLFALLSSDDLRGAHSSYNAWIRRLVSLERCLESEDSRRRRVGSTSKPVVMSPGRHPETMKTGPLPGTVSD